MNISIPKKLGKKHRKDEGKSRESHVFGHEKRNGDTKAVPLKTGAKVVRKNV